MSGPMTRTFGGTMSVANGPTLRISGLDFHGPEFHTEPAQVPDPRWEATDSHGHVHRWWERPEKRDAKPELPTLTRQTRHIECGGECDDWDCDGYTQVFWTCTVCGDEVEPGRMAGTVTFQTAAGWYELTADHHGATFPDLLEGDHTAAVEWPSGPGQVMHLTGTLTEITDEFSEVYVSRDGVRVQRLFRLLAAKPV